MKKSENCCVFCIPGSAGDQLTSQLFDVMVYNTDIPCFACPEEEGDHKINAMAEWCDVNRILACKEKGMELKNGV